ncbi:hypothetical protein TCAL_02092 [Tigriopus californicus]|uniref:RNA polymerase II subunit B1 CTD phosphatase RPAP2 homolog n=1 Tax=Tigriopus californicus TaxID=6832 RepID=A0A553NDI7_TIGCA|nr:hypothetical protein TCAL_02092 [Tigriopus californicus]
MLSADEEAFIAQVRPPPAAHKPAESRAKLTAEERSVKIALGLEKKKWCDKRAVDIVEQLIETHVDPERLRQWYYDDIVEERSCVRLCGYPLCSTLVTQVPRQRFKISTSANKVFDITERKKFCSNQCFKRSVFFKNQLATSPLWLRADDPDSVPPPVVFLDETQAPSSSKINGLGEEIQVATLTKDDVENFIDEEPETPIPPSFPTQPERSLSFEDLQVDVLGEKMAQVQLSPRAKPSKNVAKVEIPSLDKVERSLSEWVTLSTIQMLKGEDFLRETMVDNDMSVANVAQWEVFKKANENPAFKSRYVELCRKLRLQELEEEAENHMNTSSHEPEDSLKPMPNFHDIKEEVEEQSLKVNSFWQGKTIIEKHVKKDEHNMEEDQNVEEVRFLPLVDRHAQGALRRRLVHDQLDRVFPDILSLFGIRHRDISDRLSDLVTTFELTAKNIVLQMTDWTLMSIYLLNMLAYVDLEVKDRLLMGKNRKNLNLILLGYQTTIEHLNAWIDFTLSDIHSAVRKLDF